jgi:hypothetical protein
MITHSKLNFMINKSILLAVLTITVNYSFAQVKRELNWQDFMNSVKSTEVAKPVNNGSFTIFQITDINKFLYKVEIEGKVFELQTPIPTELQTLFRLTPEQIAQRDADNKVKEAASIIEDDKNKMVAVKNKMDVKLQTVDNEKIADLSKTMTKLVRVCEEYYKKTSKLSEDVFSLKSARSKLISIAQSDRSFSSIKAMLNDVTIPDAEIVKQDFIALQQLYNKVEATYNEALKKAEEAKKDVQNSLNEANEAAKTAGNEQAALPTNASTTKKNAAKEKIEGADILAKDALSLQKSTVDYAAEIKQASDGVEEADELISDEVLLSLLDEVDFLYKELGNKNNFNVVSPPVQMDGDMVSYNVNITPCVTRTIGPNKSPMTFKFDIPARRGLKVDFSVGPALSFSDNSKDDKYFLEEVVGSSPDSVKLKRLDNNNSLSPSLAAMMHVYSRGAKGFALGGLFGVGVGFQSSTELNVNVYTGISLVAGKREKVMFNVGCSWLRVDRIKNKQFADGTNYAASKITIGDVTEKVFKPAFFFGISYNLTNKVEIK